MYRCLCHPVPLSIDTVHGLRYKYCMDTIKLLFQVSRVELVPELALVRFLTPLQLRPLIYVSLAIHPCTLLNDAVTHVN